MIFLLLNKLSSSELVSVALFGLIAFCVVTGCFVGAIGIIAGETRTVRVARIETALKQDMLQRGMSAEEIERVLAAGAPKPAPSGNRPEEDAGRYAREGPATCDIAAQDSDGDWHQAVLLGMETGRCLVHYIGSDESDNEWISTERVRFPSSVACEAKDGIWPDDYNAQVATVERDGEWQPAYVLLHLDKCYVHYVGSGADENEWVSEHRVRFAGGPGADGGKASSRRTGSASAHRGKPEPLELEV
jgi:hypothetical protein